MRKRVSRKDAAKNISKADDISAMLHKLRPVLSARQYRQLRKAVNTHADYRSKKACILRFSEEMAAQ